MICNLRSSHEIIIVCRLSTLFSLRNCSDDKQTERISSTLTWIRFQRDRDGDGSFVGLYGLMIKRSRNRRRRRLFFHPHETQIQSVQLLGQQTLHNKQDLHIVKVAQSENSWELSCSCMCLAVCNFHGDVQWENVSNDLIAIFTSSLDISTERHEALSIPCHVSTSLT